MAKAESAKPKPTGRKAPAAKDEKSQRERFIETARELNADESGANFEAAFSKIIKKQTKS